MIIASELFPIGHGGGNYFDEYTLIHIPRIVGIKSIEVGYHSVNLILYIQLTYLLQDGNTWVAPVHGMHRYVDRVYVKIWHFEEREKVANSGFFKFQSTAISVRIKQLSLRTQKEDGTITLRSFPQLSSRYDDPMFRFTSTGVILGVYGYSRAIIKSLGFYYSLQRTELFGGDGGGGGAFDVESIANIASIKAIKIWYLSFKILSFEVTYLNAAGETLDAMQYGTIRRGNVTLVAIEFEEDEEIVQMYIGTLTYYFYPRNPIKIVTQKKDGSTKEYGPFGCYQHKRVRTIWMLLQFWKGDCLFCPM